jgi:DNA-binding NtrC family response regulator
VNARGDIALGFSGGSAETYIGAFSSWRLANGVKPGLPVLIQNLEAAIAWLQTQAWPGNVRELENVVRQALLLARPLAVTLEHVQQVLAREAKSSGLTSQTISSYIAELLARVQRGEAKDAYWKMIADFEPELFAQAIQLAQGNQAKAARWLGVTRLIMHEKLTQLGLHPASERTSP